MPAGSMGDVSDDEHIPSIDVTRRRRAIILAGRNGDAATVHAALSDAEPIVRGAALSALERAGAIDNAQVSSALYDSSPVVRRRAAQIAALHPTVDLLLALRDDDDTVVEMAAWAMGEQPDTRHEAIDALCDVSTSHDDALCREAGVAALGAIGDERGLQAILHGTTDKPAVRRRAVLALAPFSGESVDVALQRALEDRDWQVRQAAEDLLRS